MIELRFLHEEICLFNCARYQISEMPNGTKSFLVRRRGTYTSADFTTKVCTVVYLEEAAKPLKQCLRIRQSNALSHLPFIRGAVLKKFLFHHKNLLQNESLDCDFGRGCKTFEAVSANWAEQRFIPSAFD